MSVFLTKAEVGLMVRCQGHVYKIRDVTDEEARATRLDDDCEPIEGPDYTLANHELAYPDTELVAIDLMHFARTGDKRIYRERTG